MSWMWGNSTSASSHQSQRDEHLYDTCTVKMAWSSGLTTICHNSRRQLPGNGADKQEWRNNVHHSVYGALITTSTMGGASGGHANL